jgi:predicted transport protein
VATPDEQRASMVANLPEKTGRSLEEWKALLGESGLAKHGEMVSLLKKEHGVTHGFANLIVHEFRGGVVSNPAPDADLVEAQYDGKERIRPLYDRIMKEVAGFGSDVEVAPKKAYVSLRRKTQFALLQPSTKTRLDVGIKLKGVDPTERLEASGSFNSMVTHRVRVSESAHVDDELVAWLRQAYEGAS